MKKIYIFLFSSMLAFHAKAQVLAWDFNGRIGSELAVPATTVDPNITASSITRGVVIATALPSTFAATNWTTTNSIADAIANNSYYQFNAKANVGFKVDFIELNANFRRSSTGPRNFQWKYSIDGTTFSNIGSQITYTGTESLGAAQPAVDLTAIPALQNANSNTTITFRLYGYNAVNSAGSFGFGRISGDDINFSGKVSPHTLLAIKLVNFSAVNNGKITRLHWNVLCTSTSVKFEMERAGDDRNFHTIYTSTETQARCAQPFDLNDDNTLQGANFYRLKIIDTDGKISYSNTLYIDNKNALNTEIKVFPTLVSTHANISIPSDKNYTATIIFIDNQGRQVTKTEAQLFKGSNNVSVNTADLAPGKYYIKVVGGTQKNNTAVLIKQ